MHTIENEHNEAMNDFIKVPFDLMQDINSLSEEEEEEEEEKIIDERGRIASISHLCDIVSSYVQNGKLELWKGIGIVATYSSNAYDVSPYVIERTDGTVEVNWHVLGDEKNAYEEAFDAFLSERNDIQMFFARISESSPHEMIVSYILDGQTDVSTIVLKISA